MNKILVVDDDKEMGRLLQTLFEIEGYDVTLVRRYEEIMPAFAQVDPDCVFMDVRVQDEETISLVEQIRQETEFASVPIVMASGLDRSYECVEAGANTFLLKPFLPNDLISVIKETLGE
jgi:DNA-binding response OmpR family regulator